MYILENKDSDEDLEWSRMKHEQHNAVYSIKSHRTSYQSVALLSEENNAGYSLRYLQGSREVIKTKDHNGESKVVGKTLYCEIDRVTLSSVNFTNHYNLFLHYPNVLKFHSKLYHPYSSVLRHFFCTVLTSPSLI